MNRSVTTFLQDETGAVTVDWAMLTAGVTAVGIASATVMIAGSQSYTVTMEAQLLTYVNGVGDVEVPAVIVEPGGDEQPVEFGFAAIDMNPSTSSARVSCGDGSVGCGQSSETTTQAFVMTDGSVWRRSVTRYAGGSEETVWYGADNQPTTTVPDLPTDGLPEIRL